MKAVVLLAVIAAFVACAAAAAPLLAAESKTAIPDSYIVVFKQISKVAQDAHIRRVKGLAATIGFQYAIGKTFAGYSAVMSNATLTAVLNMPEVKYVERNQEVHTTQTCAIQTATPSWGLDRIAEVDIDFLDSQFPHDTAAGTGVDAYIIDTGIYVAHVDFGGRAIWGANYVDTNNADCNGHGTHVAGTVGGTTYGVAKKANLIAVKVLNCAGSGSWEGVIAGVQYVATRHATTGRPSTANMSLGGGLTQSLNDAVDAASAEGVIFVVAAGNSNDNACSYSPASAPSAISVGSTAVGVDAAGNPEDDRSSFSNHGTCVDVFAPGSLITSAWIGSLTASNTISGTSMASPHICGIATTIVTYKPTATPAEVKAEIANTGVTGKINLNCGTNAGCNASPNVLGFVGCA